MITITKKVKDILGIADMINSITWEELVAYLLQLLGDIPLPDALKEIIQAILAAIQAYQQLIALIQQIQSTVATLKKASKIAIAILVPPMSNEVTEDAVVEAKAEAKQIAEQAMIELKFQILNYEIEIEVPTP